jgi:hypothetical protein
LQQHSEEVVPNVAVKISSLNNVLGSMSATVAKTDLKLLDFSIHPTFISRALHQGFQRLFYFQKYSQNSKIILNFEL